ncbi:response regulator transcription factor [Saccharicrinis sp. 156]|uniref:response regulator transcription factor n=1 Tax=Saccharicrinis sp. 156 TaxID=3417574 RepID=UPI003D34B4C0
MKVFTDKPYQEIISEIDQLFVENILNSAPPLNRNDILNKDFNCADNQFCYISQFPGFKLTFISKNFQRILEFDPVDISLKSLFKLIHPNDLSNVSSSYRNACEFIINNYAALDTGANILSLKFGLKHRNNEYLEVLNTNYLYEKRDWNKSFKLLSYCTLIPNRQKWTSNTDASAINLETVKNRRQTPFTLRELEVLNLLTIGKSSHEIGTILHISKHTVDTHRRKMLSKTKLCNTPELVAYGLTHGLITS